MKLFRIDYEWDECLNAGEYETHRRYRYVLGYKRLGKMCLDLVMNENVIVDIWKLCFSLRGFFVCLKNTDSQFYNRTSEKGEKIYGR